MRPSRLGPCPVTAGRRRRRWRWLYPVSRASQRTSGACSASAAIGPGGGASFTSAVSGRGRTTSASGSRSPATSLAGTPNSAVKAPGRSRTPKLASPACRSATSGSVSVPTRSVPMMSMQPSGSTRSGCAVSQRSVQMVATHGARRRSGGRSTQCNPGPPRNAVRAGSRDRSNISDQHTPTSGERAPLRKPPGSLPSRVSDGRFFQARGSAAPLSTSTRTRAGSSLPSRRRSELRFPRARTRKPQSSDRWDRWALVDPLAEIIHSPPDDDEEDGQRDE